MKEKVNRLAVFTKGIIKENPNLVLLLGTCPTLATTSSAFNGMGMGIAATVVLICSNIVISILAKAIPDKVRIPCYIVVIAGFVTLVQFIVQAFAEPLYNSLGVFLPLIVVNCIILGRAETYASKHGPILSIFDGLGIGLGFTIGLTLIGIVRELLGAGTLFGYKVTPENFEPVSIFVLAPGAFFVLSILCALMNKINPKGADKRKKHKGGCCGNCEECGANKGGNE